MPCFPDSMIATKSGFLSFMAFTMYRCLAKSETPLLFQYIPFGGSEMGYASIACGCLVAKLTTPHSGCCKTELPVILSTSSLCCYSGLPEIFCCNFETDEVLLTNSRGSKIVFLASACAMATLASRSTFALRSRSNLKGGVDRATEGIPSTCFLFEPTLDRSEECWFAANKTDLHLYTN
jgi:hypothetical protein